MNNQEQKQVSEVLSSLIQELGYEVYLTTKEITISGSVIMPTIREMVRKAGYELIQSEYRHLVGRLPN